MQEQELIAQLIDGDNGAFKQLVESHKDNVYNTCVGFLRNVEDAEDIAQEVFIEVYNSIETFKGESSLRTWIYRIAVNKCLELLRYRKRQKRFSFFQALISSENVDEIEDQNMYAHPGVDLENKERAAVLMDAINQLPETQKVAFTLHKIEELSYKEIANIMEKSLSAVESLMHRAKKNLHDDLYDYYTS